MSDGCSPAPVMVTTEDLSQLLTRLSVMESQLQGREAQFQAAAADAAEREAAAAQRERELQNQIATLSSALNRANQAAWDAQSSTGPDARPDPPRPLPVTSVSAPPVVPLGTPPATPPKRPASAKKVAAAKGRSTPRKKTAAQVHRVLKDELPDDITGFKEAFFLHLRILWGLLVSFAVPAFPPDCVLALFDQQFASMSAVMAARTGPALVAPDLITIAGSGRNTATHGTHAHKAAQVEETALGFMATFLARFGLSSWAPDFRRSAYSLYNSACRIVAIMSFQQALLAHAYVHLAPVLKYAQDMPLMIKLYDHFVHHTQYRRWYKETLLPGVTALRESLRTVYQRRTRLKNRRVKQLKLKELHRYVPLLDDAKAHSDDEKDPQTGKYIVHDKPGRSSRVTRLVRMLDAEYERDARSLGRNPGHHREIQDVMPPAQFPMLPRKVTLDWFDADFYNSLSTHVRKRVAKYRSVVLHEDDRFVLASPVHKYELMPMEQFMKRFGELILTQYDIPSNSTASTWTEEDEYWLKGGGNSDDEADDEGDDDVMMEDDEAMAEAIDAALSEEQILFREEMQS